MRPHCHVRSFLLGLVAMHLLTLSTGVQGQREWKRFTSPTGFSVTYPSSWRRTGVSTDRLDILSSADFAPGVVIARGEAEIVVTELQDSKGTSLSQLIDRYTRGESVLSRREVPGESADSRGCRTLTEIVFTFAVGPGVYEIDTIFYCELQGRKFSTASRNWTGDRRQAEYQRVALRVARSLRVAR